MGIVLYRRLGSHDLQEAAASRTQSSGDQEVAMSLDALVENRKRENGYCLRVEGQPRVQIRMDTSSTGIAVELARLKAIRIVAVATEEVPDEHSPPFEVWSYKALRPLVIE